MKVARVILFTNQMETMSQFYSQVIGLEQMTNEKGWREFDAGGVTIALHSGPPSPGSKGPKIVFYAKDVTAAVDQFDLFIAFRDGPNTLFRNDHGTFSDVAEKFGLADPRKSVGAVWFDADEDGDLDLAVANMDGDANGLFRNDGDRFTDVAGTSGVDWSGRAPRNPANGTVRLCAADLDGEQSHSKRY